MDTLDTNRNGYIDYTEFLAGCMRSKIYLKEDHLRSAFEFFDTDNSGTITLDELKRVLSSDDMRIPENEIINLLNEVDMNKDGQLDYNEFLEMMKKDLKI
jgi:calcium-dependent protein kinase